MAEGCDTSERSNLTTATEWPVVKPAFIYLWVALAIKAPGLSINFASMITSTSISMISYPSKLH